MSLPVNIQELCENSALGQVLSDYGDLTYSEVVESLESDGDKWNTNDAILIWEPFEDMFAEDVAKHLASLYDAFESVAAAAIEAAS